MKEIEIKAKLRDKKAVMKKLESLGCKFEPMVTQEDIVYTKMPGSVKDYRVGGQIQITDDHYTFSFQSSGKTVSYSTKDTYSIDTFQSLFIKPK
jgi:adenylate cyclase class IV